MTNKLAARRIMIQMEGSYTNKHSRKLNMNSQACVQTTASLPSPEQKLRSIHPGVSSSQRENDVLIAQCLIEMKSSALKHVSRKQSIPSDGCTLRSSYPHHHALTTQEQDPPADSIKGEPRANDVLFGRGRSAKDHPGNIRMRNILSRFKKTYTESGRIMKAKIIDQTIAIITSYGVREKSRFLKRKKGGRTRILVRGGLQREMEQSLPLFAREKARKSVRSKKNQCIYSLETNIGR